MKFPENISEQLSEILSNISVLKPEIALVFTFVIILLTDLFAKKYRITLLGILALAGIGITGFLEIQQVLELQTVASLTFQEMLSVTPIAVFFKLVFLVSALLTVLFALDSDRLKENNLGELFSILFLILIGLNFLVVSQNLLMIYLSVEFVSIGSYVLATFAFNKTGSEAGLKYFIFGAVSSAIMLYGMSLLYGLSGTLVLNETLFAALQHVNTPIVALALFMTAGGFLFKIGAFPFHTWVPDIYQAAPTPVTAFFSVAPKAAGFAILLKLLYPLSPTIFSYETILPFLVVIATITLAIGNFSALKQWNAKRLIAYSSIAHAGFILCAMLTVSTLGTFAITYYIATYVLMNFAAFILVDMMSKEADSEDVRNFAGLGLKFPFIGVIFVITMVSLTGLPPTVGFYAKLFVFTSVWETYQQTGNSLLMFVLVFGILNAVISLFYYLKIPYYMFFKKSESETVYNIARSNKILATILSILIIWIFLKPEWLTTYLNTLY
jgi:NADH-quinone oxidoreductase subunit N